MLTAMDRNVSALERAFQLAKLGEVGGVPKIRAQLKREGYDDRVVEGRSLISQLQNLIKIARSDSANASRP
jgi:hypothetical protein